MTVLHFKPPIRCFLPLTWPRTEWAAPDTSSQTPFNSMFAISLFSIFHFLNTTLQHGSCTCGSHWGLELFHPVACYGRQLKIMWTDTWKKIGSGSKSDWGRSASSACCIKEVLALRQMPDVPQGPKSAIMIFYDQSEWPWCDDKMYCFSFIWCKLCKRLI